MTTRRYFANAAPQRTLSGSLTSSASSLAVSGTFAGWPTQFPFYATLDIGTASAEIVLVTAVASSTATIVRGQDGTAAITHASGATFDQTVVRQDFDEASAHTSANAGVHGVSGSVVGTTDSQTLTNKTLASPIVTGTLAGASETLSGTLAVTGAATVGGTLTSGAHTATGSSTFVAPAATALVATVKPKAAGVALNVRDIADGADKFTVTDTGTVVAKGTVEAAGFVDDSAVFTGTPAAGSFDATKPVRRAWFTASGTSNASALYNVAMPVTATCLLYADGRTNNNGADGVWRYDGSTLTSLQFQLRDGSGNQLPSTAYTIHGFVDYQS